MSDPHICFITFFFHLYALIQLSALSIQLFVSPLSPTSYEEEVFTEWTQGVDDIAKTNLDKPLLLRNPSTQLISVNFDPQLVALLREVKYLQQREASEQVIPGSAEAVFAKDETYRKYLQVSVAAPAAD